MATRDHASPPGAKGFVLLRVLGVERIFSWLNRWQRAHRIYRQNGALPPDRIRQLRLSSARKSARQLLGCVLCGIALESGNRSTQYGVLGRYR